MTDPNNMLSVLAFIRTYVAEHQTGPLVSEIAAGCGLTKYQAYRCVRILHEQNRIRKTWRQRSIVPVDVPEAEMRLSAYHLQERKAAEYRGKLYFD